MPQKPTKKQIRVTMANSLVRAAHGLTLSERRILMLAISKINDQPPAGNPPIRVYAREIVEFAKVTPQTAYDEAKAGQKKLYDRSITLLHDPITGEEKPGAMRWVTRVHYQKSEGWLEIVLNQDLLPYISELKKEFTSYNHARIGEFRSIYSCRVFDLVMQFKKKGLLRISLDDFSNAIEAPPSFRSNFSNMRQRVIEPALKEIKEKDGLEVNWSTQKKGRKVIGLEFTFPPEQAKAPMPTKAKLNNRPKLDKAYIEKHAYPGESWEAAERRLMGQAN